MTLVADQTARRAARERAVGLLYEAEVKDQPAVEVLAALPVAPDDYVVEVVTGVTEHAAELDEAITRYARNWDLDRMPALDRAILRLAAYELGHRPDVPRNVVINEAVELAKVFSTEESGKFVNGMLSAMAPDLRPEAGH
jgi:transcription antitermination protein NusB